MAAKIHDYLMDWGYRCGCHQRTDRSFFVKGYQFPVCARCTGVLVGYLASIPFYILYGGEYLVCIFLSLIMLADWLIQFLEIRESTNFRRFITGICGGYGIMTIQLQVLNFLWNWLKSMWIS